MIEFKNKRIFFSGIGDQVNIEELKNYILKNDALFVDTIAEANCIIEGDRTLPNIADDIYKAKLNGIEVIELNFLEKQFTQEFRFDSVLMAIKLSKDNERLLSLLKNKYFSDDMFVQLLKFYDWGGLDLYDNDENRDVCRQISLRFSTQNLSNHNIQYSPIGVYYAALETSNTQLLDLMYTMPSLSISFKNAKENQPLNLKEVVALNPNNSKTVQRQIIHNHQKRELYQLACNTNIYDAIKQELKELNDNEILEALLQSENYLLANQSELEMIMSNDVLKKYFLQYQKFDDTLFELLMEKISSDMEWIYVSKNSTLSTQMLQKIEEHNIPNATVNVLRHNRVDSNTVNKYLTLRDKIFNIALGHNEALSADQFQILYDTEDYDVHLSLASNTQTPKSIIVKLFTQQDFNIGHCLASNTATPLPFLLQLMLDNTLKMIVSENPTYRDDAKSKIGHMQ